MHRSIAASLLGLIFVGVVGCGGGAAKPADRASASGTVIFKGSPLPGGTIGFQAANGVTKTSAPIRDGRFETDRAPLGEITVSISTASLVTGNPAAYVAIPDRYTDPSTSGLTATISEDGATDLTFALEE